MSLFKPQNRLQKLVYEKYGISQQRDFEASIGQPPYNIPRTTARYWWLRGVPRSVSAMLILRLYLDIPLDDLAIDNKSVL